MLMKVHRNRQYEHSSIININHTYDRSYQNLLHRNYLVICEKLGEDVTLSVRYTIIANVLQSTGCYVSSRTRDR